MSRPSYGAWVLKGKMPRSTKYSRRKRSMELQSEVPPVEENHLHLFPDNTENPVGTEGDRHESSSSSLEKLDSNVDSLSTTDEEILPPTVPKVRRRKKRKRTTLLNGALSDSTSTEESIVDAASSASDSFSAEKGNDHHPDARAQNEKNFLGNCTEFAQAICPCTDIAVGDIVFMVLSLGVRHKLTWDAQVDILKMLATIHKNVGIPDTKYLYFKYLGVPNLPISFQIFCNFCESYLGPKQDMEDITKCPKCDSDLNVNSPANSFVSLSIKSQLATFLKDENFVKNILTHRFQQRSEPQHYNDVYDGAFYKGLSEDGGVLSNPLNFSYTFFVDGMVFGPSSDKTIWPIYLTINELPYEERSKYLILAGLYVGPKDPNLKVFLTPFVNEANKLSDDGVQWVHNNEPVVSKVIPLCCVADSVARCKLMNYQTFSATYGCTFCYQKSIATVKAQKYPLGEKAPLRTEESLLEDLHQVASKQDLPKEEDRVHRGVKGVSPLYHLNFFKMTKCCVVDYMHCILIGVTKAHMENLLDSKNKKMWKRIGNERVGKKHLLALIDSRIKKIKSCSSIMRELRPASKMGQWKASEYRIWLIFYCIPCLMDLLKIQFVSHLALLSKATYILLQQSASYSDVIESQKLFVIYSFYYQKYFGKENMTYNIHLLSNHITEGVLNFGPMVGHNGFVYEAQNRYVGEMGKSPFAIVYQIARKFLVYRSLPTLCSKIVTSQEVMLFSESILDYKKLKKCFKPFKGCSLLVKGTFCPLLPPEKNALQAWGNVDYYEQSYQRMILNGTIYCTKTYCQNYQNNDSCVLLNNGDTVLIRHILVLPSQEIVIVCEKLNVLRKPCVGNNHTKINHIRDAKPTNIVSCTSLLNIVRPCAVMLSPKDNIMVSPIPYGCSVE